MVNDCVLESQTNTVTYYQDSRVKNRLENNSSCAAFRLFNKRKATDKITFPNYTTFLESQKICSLQSEVIIKLQTLLFQKTTSKIVRYTFVNEIIISKLKF
jgi:hypothetical protein